MKSNWIPNTWLEIQILENFYVIITTAVYAKEMKLIRICLFVSLKP